MSYKIQTTSNLRPTAKVSSDGIYINQQVNGWSLTLDVSELGKITLAAHRTIGRTARTIGRNNEANLSIRLETVDHRTPDIKAIRIGSGTGYGAPNFCELNDSLSRTTESFKEEDKYYKRYYQSSSILTVDEFFSELIPHFEQLLKDSKLDNYISKIAEEAANIQKPYNRGYTKQ